MLLPLYQPTIFSNKELYDVFKKVFYTVCGIGLGFGFCYAIDRKMGNKGDTGNTSELSDRIRDNAERAVNRLAADVDKLGR